MNDESRTEFGSLLRQAREQRGISLQQVAATTKISARVLDALERNDPSKLPGGIFSRSFVRAYAREVGLDPEETVNRFVAAFPPDAEEQAPAAARSVDVESFESGRRAAITVFQILGASALILIVALVYMNLRPAPRAPSEPPPVVAPAVTAQPAAASAVEDPLTADDTAAPTGTELGTSSGDVPTPAPVAGSVPPNSASPSSRDTAPLSPTPEAPVALSVVATEECWLSLTVDGTKVVARVLQPGERLQYRGRVAVLSAGNAGGITIRINGRPGRPLGNRGQVINTTLTAESIKALIQ